MIVIMVGLPGTGKSTLSRELAARLHGAVVDKDAVRAAMFGAFVDYTRRQDDMAMEAVYAAAQYMAASRPVFIDGRAFARNEQFQRALEIASVWKWRVIETACSDESVRLRLAAQPEHLAKNRSFELYAALQVSCDPIPEPKLVVDTDRPFEDCVNDCLRYLL